MTDTLYFFLDEPLGWLTKLLNPFLLGLKREILSFTLETVLLDKSLGNSVVEYF